MNKNRYRPYSLAILLWLGFVFNPAFAEVTSLKTNNESFYKGEQIEFSGTVENDSTGLVTIVIRDLNNEFVLLTQAIINHDNSFEKSVKIENRFVDQGTYNATGFILNMTKGVTTNFEVSLNQIPIIHDNKDMIGEEIKQEIIKNDKITINELDKDAELIETIDNTRVVNFVDLNKDPYHYVERYYSEPTYKSWFDRNYPGLTIEDAVGYTDSIGEIRSAVKEIIDKDIIPEAQASSIVKPIQKIDSDSDIAQILLAIAGVGILFGAVYGIKRQVDNNSRQISINKNIIRKKIIQPILGLNPKEIIQLRLAKGEITLEEYEKLKTRLN